MRKAITMLLLIVFVGLGVFATDLHIRAYKVGENNPPVVHINNRITQQDVSTGDVVSITQRIDDILGDTSSVPNDFEGYIVASYRVEGSTTGNYTLSFEMTDFQGPNGNSVDCIYQLGNFNAVFVTGSSQIQTSTAEGFSIALTDSQKQVGAKATGTTGDVIAKLESSWGITPDSSNGETPVPWSVRGAIGLLVDSKQFSDASLAYGSYESEIKVFLTSNS